MPEHSLPQPSSDCALLIRTDYANHRAWQLTVEAVQTPSEEDFTAGVTFVDDPAWEGADAARIIGALPDGYRHPILIVSDEYAQQKAGFPLLVIDMRHQPGRSVRVAADVLWDIENNLSIANTDWEDYADHTDSDGVYRGLV